MFFQKVAFNNEAVTKFEVDTTLCYCFNGSRVKRSECIDFLGGRHLSGFFNIKIQINPVGMSSLCHRRRLTALMKALHASRKVMCRYRQNFKNWYKGVVVTIKVIIELYSSLRRVKYTYGAFFFVVLSAAKVVRPPVPTAEHDLKYEIVVGSSVYYPANVVQALLST